MTACPPYCKMAPFGALTTISLCSSMLPPPAHIIGRSRSLGTVRCIRNARRIRCLDENAASLSYIILHTQTARLLRPFRGAGHKENAPFWIADDTRLLFRHLVLLQELLDAALGVHDLLLAGVERMAVGADLHADVLAGRTRLEGIAALADDRSRGIVRVNPLFHLLKLLSPKFSPTIIYERGFPLQPRQRKKVAPSL